MFKTKYKPKMKALTVIYRNVTLRYSKNDQSWFGYFITGLVTFGAL